MKIKVFLLTADETYARKIYNAFLREYSDTVDLIIFDSVDTMQGQVRKLYPDIVLVDEELRDVRLSLPQSAYLALLSDNSEAKTIMGHMAVGKYQRISGIHEQILDIYSVKQEMLSISVKENDPGKIKIVTFMSPAGGTGASTLAAACARQLALKGENVIYLNLEQFGTADAYFSGEGSYDFERVIFAVALGEYATASKNGDNSKKEYAVATKMESALKKDISGVRFYSGCKNSLDMQGILNEEAMENLFENFRKMKNVRWIVADCDCNLNEMTYKQIERSYLSVVVSDGTEASNRKTERYLGSLELIGNQRDQLMNSRVFIMYNRFGSSEGKRIKNQAFKEIGKFGRVENATVKEIMELMDEAGLFNSIMYEL